MDTLAQQEQEIKNPFLSGEEIDQSKFLPDQRQTKHKRNKLPAPGKRFTRKKKTAFLEHLASTGILAGACKEIGITTGTYYQHREKDPAFAALADMAIEFSTASLEEEAIRRGRDGTLKDVYYKGQVVGQETIKSDRMLELMLRARNPDLYGGKAQVELSGGVEVSGARSRLLELLGVSVEDIEDAEIVQD